jgi:hypothetical protein
MELCSTWQLLECGEKDGACIASDGEHNCCWLASQRA